MKVYYVLLSWLFVTKSGETKHVLWVVFYQDAFWWGSAHQVHSRQRVQPNGDTSDIAALIQVHVLAVTLLCC
jgi:hypothetical protein